MSWMEIELSPQSDWNEECLEDWAEALGAFLIDKGVGSEPQILMLPGYYVLQLGKQGIGELTLSCAERLVLLDGLSLKEDIECDFARFVVRFALQMGAVGVCASISSSQEKEFWHKLGGIIRPDPIILPESIRKEKVKVKQLANFSLLVTYEDYSTLCLEPIRCNAHASGPISLAQRRLEKEFGGNPIGFASRVAIHCPWDITKEQWNDLLSYSRLQAFDLLSELVFSPAYQAL